MPILNSPAGQVILTSSSTGAGSWYRRHPKMSKLTFQVVHVGTSAGATVGSSVTIEASNDGVNALATVLGSVVLSGDTPQSDGFAIDAPWEYFRAKIGSVTAATAGSTGPSFAISVAVSAQQGR